MTETAQTIKDSLEVIAPYLQNIAEQIGQQGLFVYQLQVKQAYIDGVSILLRGFTALAIAFAAYKIARHFNFMERMKSSEEGEWLPLFIIVLGLGVVAAGALVGFMSDVNQMLTCFINPDLVALKALIKMVK